MHNQVSSGSTSSIFLLQVLPLRCDMQGWPRNKNFISQFRRKKMMFFEVFQIRFHYASEQNHYISKTFTCKAQRGKRRGGQAANRLVPQWFPSGGESLAPSSQALSDKRGTATWTPSPEGQGQPDFLPPRTPLVNSLSPSAPISLEPLHSM